MIFIKKDSVVLNTNMYYCGKIHWFSITESGNQLLRRDTTVILSRNCRLVVATVIKVTYDQRED